MKVSIIVPCYNEEKIVSLTIPYLQQILSSMGINFEIIAVSDGSSDRTVKEIKELKLDNVKVIELKENQGKGAALKEGFSHSNGNIIFFHDADLTLSPETINLSLKALETNDIVLASKNLLKSSFARPLYRRFLSRLFNTFVRTTLKIALSDTQTGFKAFHRKPLETIISQTKTNKFETDLEISWLANKKGYRIKEIPLVGNSIRRHSRFFSFKNFLGIVSVAFWLIKKILKRESG